MSTNISDSQGDTGTRDVTYDLISVAYHLLQGAETISMYIEDAEQEGDEELARFFRETKDNYTKRADEAKQLLARYISQSKRQAAGGS